MASWRGSRGGVPRHRRAPVGRTALATRAGPARSGRRRDRAARARPRRPRRGHPAHRGVAAGSPGSGRAGCRAPGRTPGAAPRPAARRPRPVVPARPTHDRRRRPADRARSRARSAGTGRARRDRPAPPRAEGAPATVAGGVAGRPGRTTRVRHRRVGTRRAAACRRQQPLQRVLDDARPASPSDGPGRASGTARACGPSAPAASPARPRPARGTRAGIPIGTDTPIASRYRATSSTAIQRSSPRDPHPDRPPGASSSCEPGRRDGDWPAFRAAPPPRRVRSPSRRRRSWTWSSVDARRSSVSACRLSSRSASASGSSSSRSSSWPEQLAEQVAVEGQRAGSAFGQRRVAVVHVGRDVVEQEAARERRGARRLDAVDGDLAAGDPGQDLAQRRQVEDVAQALAIRLDEDREAAVAAGDREEVRRPLALLPERRPRAGPAARQEQRPGRVLAEPAREQGRGRELADDEVLEIVRLREQQRLDPVQWRVAFGQPDRDPVVGPDGLDLEARGAPAAGLRCASAHGAWTRPPNGVSRHSRQSPSSSRNRSTTTRRSVGSAPVASRSSSR